MFRWSCYRLHYKLTEDAINASMVLGSGDRLSFLVTLRHFRPLRVLPDVSIQGACLECLVPLSLFLLKLR